MSAVQDRLAKHLAGLKGDYKSRDVIKDFIKDEKADPKRRAELNALADVLIYNALMTYATGWRNATRHAARAAAARASVKPRLAEAARNISEGKPSGLMAAWFTVDSEGTKRQASEMDGPAHYFVANQYASTSRRVGLFAAFHKAVAKKCGMRRTSEVFTEEQYEAMYRSIINAASQRSTDAA